MKITIVGAGNIGTQFAAHCSEKGHEVYIYTGKADKIHKELVVVNEKDEIIHRGTIAGATADPALAFSGTDYIFVTVPAFCMSDTADAILPYAKEGMTICLIPGTGGGECAFGECIKKGAVLCGLQRVPSVARLVEYGHIVRATGYRDTLYLGALPTKASDHAAKVIGELLNMECLPLPNYLNLTLTPSNPILHTTRLRTLFGDYKEGVVYASVPLFYEEWNDASSELLFLCDDEVQNICRNLQQFDLSYVKSLKEHYESNTPQKLTAKITSILGFKGLTSPTVAVEGGYIPDLNSRYFTADFPYGLSILLQIANLLELDCPNMKATLDWYRALGNWDREFDFSEYGIDTKEALLAFYAK